MVKTEKLQHMVTDCHDAFVERADWLRPMKDWEGPEATKKPKAY
jgi:hypothetical protein